MISKRRFLLKRIVDDSFGRIAAKAISLRKKTKSFPEKIETITILKLSSIGDSLLSLPAIKKLKESTGAKIIVVHSKDNECIYKNQEFIDENILLDVSKYNLFRLIKALLILRKKKADLSFDLSNTGNFSSVFAAVSGNFVSGFFNEQLPSRKGFYDREIILEKEVHMAVNYVNLLNIGDKKVGEISLITPFSDKNIDFLKDKSNLVGIHPCHEIKEKSWDRDNFAKIISYLIKKGKIPVILGSQKEKKDIEVLLSNVKERNKIIDLSGELDIYEVFSVMKHFDFFVSNDGGIMHIAASFGLPTLGIFNAETPKKFAPFNEKSFAIDSRKLSKEESYDLAKKVIDIFMDKHF